MLIYPFHNDETETQLPTRVGFGFGLASELQKSKGEIMVVEWQIGEQSSEYDWKLTAMNNELKRPMNSSAIIYFKD